jgi:hypothetical protein
MKNEKSAKEVVDEAYSLYGADKAVEVLIREYSPNCDGEDYELWQEVKKELSSRGKWSIDFDRTSMRMRNYSVTIRELAKSGEETQSEEKVLALNQWHAYERASEQFAMKHEGLDPKQWYISCERISCDD